MSIEETAGKAAIKARGILGPAFAILIVVAAQVLGVEISVAETDSIISGFENWIVSGGVILSSLVGIYGRIKASEKITGIFGG